MATSSSTRLRRRTRPWIVVGGAVTVIAAGAAIALTVGGVGDALRVASSLAAHELCSQTFVAHRDPDPVFHDYVQPMVGVPVVRSLVRYDVDRVHREVTTSIAGVYGARAVYADGRGCTVTHGAQSPAAVTVAPATADAQGFALIDAPDPALVEPLEHAFAEPEHGARLQRKAILIVQDGKILGERYAPGYDRDTPLQSWSMAKSVTNALIAILVRDGKLAVDRPAPVARWQAAGDPHHAVTIDQLLRQTSGQPFGQSNSGFDRSTQMQFLSSDTAAVAETAEFANAPGRVWSYTDGNYAILSGILHAQLGGPDAVVAFARRELFAPLGMTTVTQEFDDAGNPMGADWVFASARDWARFGMLYAGDGMVGARRILPAGWAAYVASPTPQAVIGYGASFFTNVGPSLGALRRRAAGAPADSFLALGNSGQVILIVPSRHLVIVSLGFALDSSNRGPVYGVLELLAHVRS